MAPFRRPSPIREQMILFFLLVLMLVLSAGSQARADYFPRDEFKTYHSEGRYPFWNSTWLSLDPRVRFDSQGIPIVGYGALPSYNPVTIAAFGLLAYNKFEEHANTRDRVFFLKMADWLVAHQESKCGCWYYDFDFSYLTLDDTIEKPWTSAMAQGLAISVMTRAYFLTNDSSYVRVAQRALLPFHKTVEDGGVNRSFSLAAGAAPDGENSFYEEYPTMHAPSFTLNGFMFALVGLYDLSQLNNQDAEELFRQGLHTLRVALPLYDLGDGSSYDLGHLTRPPRGVHQDDGYHLIHITLLNALGTATLDPTLLWYRDHWNGYGTSFGTEVIWLRRVAYWLMRQQQAAVAIAALLLFAILGILTRILGRQAKMRNLQSAQATLRLATFAQAQGLVSATLEDEARPRRDGIPG